MFKYLFVLLLIAFPSPLLASDIFVTVYENVDDFLPLINRRAEAAEDTWYPQPFTETKSDLNEEMNALLDEVLQQLGDDQLVKLKRGINELTAENNNLELEVADLTILRQGAATDKKIYEIWKDTQADLDDEVQKLHQKIQANKRQIEANRQAITTLLRESGLTLSESEVDSLLKTVTGDDLITSMAVLKNVHAIIANLRQVLTKSNENIHLAKKYYGLFLLVTESYAFQLDLFLERIDQQYRPKLAELEAANKELMAETEKLARQDARYRSNLKAQKITAQAAQTYHKVLNHQKERVAEHRQKVTQILTHAENTYKTVDLAHNLYQTMNEGLASYDALMSLPMLEAIPFENRDLELKFMELTDQLSR